MSPLIDPDKLLSLSHAKEVIIVDARAGTDAKARYLNNHLAGALFVDLDTELADIKDDLSNGGRHPLPSPGQFSYLLTKLGITPASHVIVYDDKNASNAAARFWWMLKSINHKKVQVLNGGFEAAISAGFPASSKAELPLIKEPYGHVTRTLPLTNINEVERATHDDNYILI
ncbi:MAG: sulfurtransferase, partial [Chitinophagaceae bacterium]|nr:sulfurtransferase [Chitinophagaceae bacterium]